MRRLNKKSKLDLLIEQNKRRILDNKIELEEIDKKVDSKIMEANSK
ncbi:hypothetical protein J6TS2_11680 [Heyndrickxia sporothermodurans]|nr:hypothetical protein J6TS2_11680 [Heyndrickxia sporothermodurans]